MRDRVQLVGKRGVFDPLPATPYLYLREDGKNYPSKDDKVEVDMDPIDINTFQPTFPESCRKISYEFDDGSDIVFHRDDTGGYSVSVEYAKTVSIEVDRYGRVAHIHVNEYDPR